ncbi:MAG: TolC family protein, partial [Bacteroidales bacterium]
VRGCILLWGCFLYPDNIWAQSVAVPFQGPAAIQRQWGELFGDPILDSLMGQALLNNKNVLQAIDRIDAAKAGERIAASAFFPQIGVEASWERERGSAGLSKEGIVSYGNTAVLGASTSWELDVFGSIRKNVKSQKELYKVSVENYYWVLVSLCSEVATAYVNLRTYQQQYVVTQQNIESQDQVLDITTARYKAGLASKLDVLQARTVYLNSKAQLPLLESQIIQAINSIYVLLGAAPQSYMQDRGGINQENNSDILSENQQYNNLPNKNIYRNSPLWKIGEIPVVQMEDTLNLALDALLDRPDIRAQEYTVNSYAASVGASTADWLPKFFLNGSVGFSSGSFHKIFRNDNLVFTVNPTVSWTLFSGRQLQEKTKLAKANWDEAVNAFNLLVITAMQEVDNAISLYGAYSNQVEMYSQVRGEGVEVLKLSLELYKKGLQDFQTVLDAQRSLLSYENSLVASRGARIAAFVQLVKVMPSIFVKN